jgi:hypothetical protein
MYANKDVRVRGYFSKPKGPVSNKSLGNNVVGCSGLRENRKCRRVRKYDAVYMDNW